MSTAAKSITSLSEPRTVSFGLTRYFAWGVGRCIESATEAYRQIPVRVTGQITNLFVRITGNSIDGNTTITLRKNGAATDLSIVVPASTQGAFYDSAGFVDVVSGDLLGYEVVTGGTSGTITVTLLSVMFTPVGQTQGTCVTRMVCASSASTTGNAITRYGQVVGDVDLTGSTEADKKINILTAGKLKYLGIYISANARSTATTLRIRINGVNGNLVVTVGAGITGWVEDLVNEDTVASGNDINWQLVTGASAENLTVECIAVTFITTNNKFIIATAIVAGQTVNFNVTSYTAAGGLHFSTTEAFRKVDNRIRIVLSGMQAYINTNTIATSASTLAIRSGGSNSALSLSIGAGATGLFTDTSTIVFQSPQDAVEFQIATPNTSGALNIRSIAVVCEFLETPKHQAIGNSNRAAVFKKHVHMGIA